MRLYAVRTGIVETEHNMVELILESLKKENLKIEDGDVLALASKTVAYTQGRVIKLSDINPSEEAEELAKKFSLRPEFAEMILQEADRIYGGVEKAVLTLKNGVLTANAGMDNKNAPEDHVILWPKDVTEWTKRIRKEIMSRTGKNIAVLIVDSGLIPLRMGTNGVALAVAGFKPVIDLRGEKDIFEKSLMITRHAVADDLASAAHLLMGEAAQKTPIVLIKDAPVVLDEGAHGFADLMIPSDECIFMKTFAPDKDQKFLEHLQS